VRGNAQPPATAWSGRTRGGVFGNWFFLTVIRTLGLRAAYFFLIGVAAWFLLASRRGYRSSAEYHQRLRGPLSLPRRVMAVYRHFFSYGMMLIDRAAIVSGRHRRFTFAFDGDEIVREALAEGKGLILLASHTGNWEAAAHLLRRYDTPCHVVGVDNEIEPIRRLMAAAGADRQVHLIGTSGAFEHSVEILSALRRGEMVALLGDRASGQALTRVPFLGRPAEFPAGAYLLAAVTGTPIVQTFTVREPGFRYRFLAHPPERVSLPRRDQRGTFLETCVRQYVDRLESMLRRHPYQWYNFYPFWDSAGPDTDIQDPGA
jgi:predicted LPLAT superfamily acyltransferase